MIQRRRRRDVRPMQGPETRPHLQGAADMRQQALQHFGRRAFKGRGATPAMDAERIDAAAGQGAARHDAVEDIGVGPDQFAVDAAVLPFEVADEIGAQHRTIEDATLDGGHAPGIDVVVVGAVELDDLRDHPLHVDNVDGAVGCALCRQGEGRAIEKGCQATSDIAPRYMAQRRVIQQTDDFGFPIDSHSLRSPVAFFSLHRG